jgi:aryl-alcohol dehydrogenase-like predicted oxidoreductase
MTNKSVSRIGLGCVTFGREIDQAASFAMMDHAVDKGITLFDTAAAYAAGASERVVGAWLAARPRAAEFITVATKVLPPYDNGQLTQSVDASLERLGLNSIDILYLHRYDPWILTREVLRELNELVQTGKVHALGASNFTAVQLKKVLQQQEEFGYIPFRFVQNNHNLAVSDLTADFNAVCTAHELDIITYSPLGAGFLTGKHQQSVQPGSRFDVIKGHQGIYFNDAACRRLEKLQTVAVRTGHSTVHLALAWALHQPVTSILVGGRTIAHIDQALAAMKFNDPGIFTELEAS